MLPSFPMRLLTLFWEKKVSILEKNERVVVCKHREYIFLPCEVEDGLY